MFRNNNKYSYCMVATLPGNLEKPGFDNLGKKTLNLRSFEKKTWKNLEFFTC